MRSAPTSRGLSVWIDRPVRVPGSTTTGGKLKYRLTMSRRAVVDVGTTDEMTTPVIWFENERPACSSRPPNRTASSSAVRSISVESRHCCWISAPRNTPSTVLVFPTFTASSIGRHLLTGHPFTRAEGSTSVGSGRRQPERVDQPYVAEPRRHHHSGRAIDPRDLPERVVVDHRHVVDPRLRGRPDLPRHRGDQACGVAFAPSGELGRGRECE